MAATIHGRRRSRYNFHPERYERELVAILQEAAGEPDLDDHVLDRILRRYPKDGRGFFSKSELVRGLRHLARRGGVLSGSEAAALAARLAMKPVRTLSGVAPVSVLTRPHPCPGRCIFCPSDVRMPKSYLASEPGAQRAAFHGFDPYLQTWSRLRALHNIGHRWDKVELIVLGGTWSSYPEPYQIWFLRRCFEALNDFGAAGAAGDLLPPGTPPPGFDPPAGRVDGRRPGGGYNRRVGDPLRHRYGGGLSDPAEAATWEELAAAQRANESAGARCVGLALETRPDCVTAAEVVRLRRLGATKVQLGVQSLSEAVLAANRRGHDVGASRRAVALLRRAGFKIHAHWMANLLGSTPERDVEDFERLFADPALRPDELKVYPCSLIESAELMRYWEAGTWRPYRRRELLRVLTRALAATPAYCRLTRVVRDIPGGDIVAGSRTTNLREVAEEELARRGVALREIRSREIRGAILGDAEVAFQTLEYEAGVAREVFLEAVAGGRLLGFLRLSLPGGPGDLPEIAASAMIREVHVYGALVSLGEASGAAAQHRGLGRRLLERAAGIASERGFADLAVISAVGTREYYRSLGFTDGELYQHRKLA